MSRLLSTRAASIAAIAIALAACGKATSDEAADACASCVDAGADAAPDGTPETPADWSTDASTTDVAVSEADAFDLADTSAGADAAAEADAAPEVDATGDSAQDAETSSVADAAADTSTVVDASGDAASDAATADAPSGPITGGPCVSGATGATAFRITWLDGGGTAYPGYDVLGLPDRSQWKVGAYGYSFGFTPQYVDTFLGPGGLQLDGSDFVDVQISTVGLTTIRSATLAIYGRSYDTTASGSFSWQTIGGIGAAPDDLVSNVTPYAWYAADATAEIPPGNGSLLLRIKAGPSSGSLVVNRIELCVDAS